MHFQLNPYNIQCVRDNLTGNLKGTNHTQVAGPTHKMTKDKFQFKEEIHL